MQNFITLGQPLSGRKVCGTEEERRKKKNNPKNSGHFVPLQRIRAAHALRSGQNIKKKAEQSHTQVFLNVMLYNSHENFYLNWVHFHFKLPYTLICSSSFNLKFRKYPISRSWHNLSHLKYFAVIFYWWLSSVEASLLFVLVPFWWDLNDFLTFQDGPSMANKKNVPTYTDTWPDAWKDGNMNRYTIRTKHQD